MTTKLIGEGKAEGRRQKAEGRGQEAEGFKLTSRLKLKVGFENRISYKLCTSQ